MNKDSLVRHNLEVQVTELQETLHHDTQALMQRLKHHESQPSAEDFEYARSEVARLQRELRITKSELRTLQAETPLSKSRKVQLGDTDAQDDEEILQSVDNLTRKLESLDRFASKFMPDGEYGVPEFKITMKRGHQKIADIESRLAQRIFLRKDRAGK